MNRKKRALHGYVNSGIALMSQAFRYRLNSGKKSNLQWRVDCSLCEFKGEWHSNYKVIKYVRWIHKLTPKHLLRRAKIKIGSIQAPLGRVPVIQRKLIQRKLIQRKRK